MIPWAHVEPQGYIQSKRNENSSYRLTTPKLSTEEGAKETNSLMKGEILGKMNHLVNISV